MIVSFLVTSLLCLCVLTLTVSHIRRSGCKRNFEGCFAMYDQRGPPPPPLCMGGCYVWPFFPRPPPPHTKCVSRNVIHEINVGYCCQSCCQSCCRSVCVESPETYCFYSKNSYCICLHCVRECSCEAHRQAQAQTYFDNRIDRFMNERHS